MHALVIGGTRNLGPLLVAALLQHGYRISVFNRGKTGGDLPKEVERLYGDRSDPQQLQSAIGNREFDLVVDTTLYTGQDAGPAVQLFAGRTRRYIFISTGQVYLVRQGLHPPFKEEDYAGAVIPAPAKANTYDYDQWVYGIEKRAAEDVLLRGWVEAKFPVTILRLPMVNSEQDHYNRIYGYFLRLRDGGPIVVPEGEMLPLRHVYGGDVVQAVLRATANDAAVGQAYNISQDETVSLEQFLAMFAELTHTRARIVRLPREKLNEAGLLPGCSPFSGTWMSVLDNARSKAELGMTYTPHATYLTRLVQCFEADPHRVVDGYAHRALELQLAERNG